MRKTLLVLVLFLLCGTLYSQQALSNDSVIKLAKAGLSEDLIVTTINASQTNFDTSSDAIIALKSAGVSEKVIAAMIVRSSAPQTAPVPVATPAPTGQSAQPAGPLGDGKPRIFLQSASKGNNRNAARDQSMEMSKDFERDCTGVKISINQATADYTVILNHIEVGLLVRDNQFQVADKNGDLISKTKEGGSIAAGVKVACQAILNDWAKKGPR